MNYYHISALTIELMYTANIHFANYHVQLITPRAFSWYQGQSNRWLVFAAGC